MTPAEIETALLPIFTKYTRKSEAELKTAELLLDLTDSLTMLEIVFEIEEKFTVKVPDEAIPQMKTFADVISGVEKLILQKV